MGATADVTSGDDNQLDDERPHGHLGVLLGVGQRFGPFGFLLLSELGVHGIGEVGDRSDPDADGVRLGYLGLRVGADVTIWGFLAVGTSLVLSRSNRKISPGPDDPN